MFGLYAGTGEPTPNRNRFVFERGGCSFAVPCRIFWRFPVAPACLYQSCCLPACVIRPASPVPLSPSPFRPSPSPFPPTIKAKENECKEHSFLCAHSCAHSCPHQKKCVFEDTKRLCFTPVPIFGWRNILQGIEKKLDLPIVYQSN